MGQDRPLIIDVKKAQSRQPQILQKYRIPAAIKLENQ